MRCAIYKGLYVGKEKPRPIKGEAVGLANVCELRGYGVDCFNRCVTYVAIE